MAVLNAPRADEYLISNSWKVWTGQTDMASEGWKFHIAVAKAEDAQPALTAVIERVLYPMKVAHKHWPTDDPVGKQDDNGGKWFAIYPASILNAFVIAGMIETVLLELPLLPPADGAIPHELKVRHGFVYTRYGSYSFRGVKGPNGFETDVRSALKPAWVDNVWVRYTPFVDRQIAVDPAWTKPFPSYATNTVPREFF